MALKEFYETIGIDRLFVQFQPIFCIGSRKIIGIEALLRGENSKGLVSPKELFERAECKNVKVELDRVARKLAFEEFKKHFLSDTEFLLFFNFDASILDTGQRRAWYIHRLVKKAGIPPNRVVIEVIETKVKNFQKLKKFVEVYRNLGFLIALDDVGIEYSNLSRIPEIKPDFIKIDRALIKGVEKNEYKRKVLKSLAGLAKDVGSFTIAEGVERDSEILATLEMGVNFHQGYRLGSPVSAKEFFTTEFVKELTSLRNRFVFYFKSIAGKKKQVYETYKSIVCQFTRKFKKVKLRTTFEKKLKKLIEGVSSIQSAYIVDMSGCLITDINFNSKYLNPDKKFFFIYRKGDNLCFYDYIYYLLSGEFDRYITEPYIHPFTKNRVCTVSQIFKNYLGYRFILCIDFLI